MSWTIYEVAMGDGDGDIHTGQYAIEVDADGTWMRYRTDDYDMWGAPVRARVIRKDN